MLGDEEVQRRTIQFVESTDFRASFGSRCGLHVTDGWQDGFEFILAGGEIARAEQWALRHDNPEWQRRLLSAAASAYTEANDPANAVRVIKRILEQSQPANDKGWDTATGWGLGQTLREIARLYLAAGKPQEARLAANMWRVARRSDLAKDEEAQIQAILGDHAEARKTAEYYAASAKQDYQKPDAFEAVWVTETVAGQAEEADRTMEAAKRSLGQTNWARSGRYEVSDYSARVLLWQGKPAADAFGPCGADGKSCSEHICKMIFNSAIKQRDLETASRAVGAFPGDEERALALLALAQSYLAANRPDDGRKALNDAIALIGHSNSTITTLAKFNAALAHIHQTFSDSKAASMATLRGFVYRNWDKLPSPVDLATDIKEAQADVKSYKSQHLSLVVNSWAPAFNAVKGFEKGLDKQLARINTRQ